MKQAFIQWRLSYKISGCLSIFLSGSHEKPASVCFNQKISKFALNEPIEIHVILPYTMWAKNKHILYEMFMPSKKQIRHFKWNSIADRLLVELVEQPTRSTWPVIAKHLEFELLIKLPPGSCSVFPNGKQCRERWYDHLNPSLSRDPFTLEQLNYIFKRKEEGAGFALIGRELNHSANQVKNSYYCIKRHKKGTIHTVSSDFDVQPAEPNIQMSSSVISVSDDCDPLNLSSIPCGSQQLRFFSDVSSAASSVSDDYAPPLMISSPCVSRSMSFFSKLSESSCDLLLNELYDLRDLGEQAEDMLSEPFFSI
ncbi:hypothetical protein Lmor_3154 [Legionella moravica]|uniref:Uncharacterized protein n=2 Tax=Legionella moravica TaxID=39962 RepID=A0A378JYZ0_9GAMM|nr:hypothetical protein Lmor_3154 [Legionella moravica]STX63626.1 Uncharacterised protein [Legionella moravica]